MNRNMMTRLQWAFLALALGAGLLGALPAKAEAPPWREAWRVLQRDVSATANRLLRQIGTTAEQRAQIRARLARAIRDARALVPDAYTLADRIANAALAEQPDAPELERLEKEGLALTARGASILRLALLEAVRVLTPEQRARLLAKWRLFKPIL